MACFCLDSNNAALGVDFYETEDGNDALQLPNLQVVTATSAANCGISSVECDRAYRQGIPPNLYDLVQELGRVDRLHSAIAGDHRYEIHMSVPSVVSLFVRIKQEKSKEESSTQLTGFMKVLKLLVTPSTCIHSYLEEYFESPHVEREREPCNLYCSHCVGESSNMAGIVIRPNLVNLLICDVMVLGECTINHFIKLLYDAREQIWHSSCVPNKLMGPVHALALKLFASGIVHMIVLGKDTEKIGTEMLHSKNIGVCIAIQNVGGVRSPSYSNESAWESINHVME